MGFQLGKLVRAFYISAVCGDFSFDCPPPLCWGSRWWFACCAALSSQFFCRYLSISILNKQARGCLASGRSVSGRRLVAQGQDPAVPMGLCSPGFVPVLHFGCSRNKEGGRVGGQCGSGKASSFKRRWLFWRLLWEMRGGLNPGRLRLRSKQGHKSG